jgi:hypothetical protein
MVFARGTEVSTDSLALAQLVGKEQHVQMSKTLVRLPEVLVKTEVFAREVFKEALIATVQGLIFKDSTVKIKKSPSLSLLWMSKKAGVRNLLLMETLESLTQTTEISKLSEE